MGQFAYFVLNIVVTTLVIRAIFQRENKKHFYKVEKELKQIHHQLQRVKK